MAALGGIDKIDCAIFADTGAEHPATLEYLNEMIAWAAANNGPPIHIVQNSSLSEDLLTQENSKGQRFASIPAYTKNGAGSLRRQCTAEYKITPIIKKIRALYGLKPRQRMPNTELLIGISTDEASRIKPNKVKAINNVFPLIDLMMNRADCRKWLANNGFSVPVKSGCIICPYQDDVRWSRMKKERPDIFDNAAAIDKAIRDSSKKGIKEKIFVHRSCMPLDKIEFGENQMDLFENECEGMCGL
jgi:hypothetical protein